MVNFFSTEGLTGTSANHIANQSKELYMNIESELKSIKFYSTAINLIGSNEKSYISFASTDVQDIPSKLNEIAQCKSLIAWIREAIKEKDRMFKEIKEYSVSQYAQDNNLEYPEFPKCDRPLTEKEYYDSLSVKDRNRYYSLETKAAVLGKYIHPDGELSKARKDFSNKLQNPISVSGSGRDSVIYKYEPEYNIEAIEKLFFELQKEHRSVQAELNGMKHLCEQAIRKSEIEAQAKHMRDIEKHKEQCAELHNNYEKYIQNKRKEIESLKIVIPNSLKSIYEKVNSLGK